MAEFHGIKLHQAAQKLLPSGSATSGQGSGVWVPQFTFWTNRVPAEQNKEEKHHWTWRKTFVSLERVSTSYSRQELAPSRRFLVSLVWLVRFLDETLPCSWSTRSTQWTPGTCLVASLSRSHCTASFAHSCVQFGWISVSDSASRFQKTLDCRDQTVSCSSKPAKGSQI